MKIISLFFLLPFALSLSLYCVSELGVVQVCSSAVSAWPMLFDHNFYFPFLEKKRILQGNNSPDEKDLNISEMLQDHLHRLLLYHCIILRL